MFFVFLADKRGQRNRELEAEEILVMYFSLLPWLPRAATRLPLFLYITGLILQHLVLALSSCSLSLLTMLHVCRPMCS